MAETEAVAEDADAEKGEEEEGDDQPPGMPRTVSLWKVIGRLFLINIMSNNHFARKRMSEKIHKDIIITFMSL